jgi:hypothetical protein
VPPSIVRRAKRFPMLRATEVRANTTSICEIVQSLEGNEERTINLDEGDVVNVPIGIYRGFRSLTDAPDALLTEAENGEQALAAIAKQRI